MDIIHHSARFDILKGMVDVKNMCAWIFDKTIHIDIFYWNYDLFMQRALGGHVNPKLWFVLTAYDFLNNFNFLVLKIWKSLLDFKHFPSNVSRVRLISWYLSIRFFSIVSRLLFFEIFQNFIYFLSRFCWDYRRKRRNIRRTCCSWFLGFSRFLDYLGTELWFDITSERSVSTVDHQIVPLRCVEGWNKPMLPCLNLWSPWFC